MVTEKIGNIFESKNDILIHGCNCFHTMGAGIAKEVKYIYPEAFYEDLKSGYGSKDKLGNFSYVPVFHCTSKNLLIVVNLYSQWDFGFNINNYKYIKSGLEKVHNTFEEKYSISLPKIGCGLAGGDWKIVKSIIYDIFNKSNRKVDIYYLSEKEK